jgi:hypothetical protein
MHSVHATSAAQATADAQNQWPSSPLHLTTDPNTSKSPTLVVSKIQDTILPDSPITTPGAEKDWMPVEGKAHRRRRRVKERKMEAVGLGKDTTPVTTGNTRRCQKMAKKTWADVVKA